MHPYSPGKYEFYMASCGLEVILAAENMALVVENIIDKFTFDVESWVGKNLSKFTYNFDNTSRYACF